ncbi:MAG: hypothetical protein IJ890_08080 [Clostridia bacterium]|nr:hypothetical protein [Clostridia bacterium]
MRRKKVKTIKLKAISIVLVAIFFLTISVGYSYLQQKLNIYGKSTITVQNDGKYINGNSIFSWNVVDTYEQENAKIYNVKLRVINKDSDISEWEVGFDIPNGYVDSKSDIESKFSKKIEDNRVKIKALNNSNTYLANGSILEIEIKLAVLNDRLEINNLTLNGKLATYNQ